MRSAGYEAGDSYLCRKPCDPQYLDPYARVMSVGAKDQLLPRAAQAIRYTRCRRYVGFRSRPRAGRRGIDRAVPEPEFAAVRAGDDEPSW
jgi:hypothetical protein